MSNTHAQSATPDTTLAPDGFDLQGHRGARGLLPENTLPAFRRALEIGVTTLELDVVIAGDGTVVVSHEPWMAPQKCLGPDGERLPEDREQAYNLHKMSYEQIEKYDCGRRTLSAFPDQKPASAPKPRLRDVIQMAEAYVEAHSRTPVFYNVEAKSLPDWDGTFQPDPKTFVSRILAVVREEGVISRTTIQSFDPRILEAVHRQDAGVRTAFLVGWAGDDGLDENLATLSFVPDIYSPTARLVDAELVAAVHNRGMKLIPWTVNKSSAMKHLIRLGVDGLITDYPNRAQSVLQTVDP